MLELATLALKSPVNIKCPLLCVTNVNFLSLFFFSKAKEKAKEHWQSFDADWNAPFWGGLMLFWKVGTWTQRDLLVPASRWRSFLLACVSAGQNEVVVVRVWSLTWCQCGMEHPSLIFYLPHVLRSRRAFKDHFDSCWLCSAFFPLHLQVNVKPSSWTLPTRPSNPPPDSHWTRADNPSRTRTCEPPPLYVTSVILENHHSPQHITLNLNLFFFFNYNNVFRIIFFTLTLIHF